LLLRLDRDDASRQRRQCQRPGAKARAGIDDRARRTLGEDVADQSDLGILAGGAGRRQPGVLAVVGVGHQHPPIGGLEHFDGHVGEPPTARLGGNIGVIAPAGSQPHTAVDAAALNDAIAPAAYALPVQDQVGLTEAAADWIK